VPVAAMLTAVFFWSGLLVAQKFLGGILGVAEIALCRFALAAAILWMVVLATRQPVRIRNRAQARPLLMGILEPGTAGFMVIWGLQHTSVITGAVLWSIMPLVMPVLGRVILKEPLRLIVAISAVIAVAGSAVLVLGQQGSGQGSMFGDILVFLGVSAACTNQLIARRVAQTGGRPLVTTSYQVTVSATLALVILILTGGFQADTARLGALEIGAIAFMGVAGGIGTFFLYNFALRYMPVGRVSLFPPLVGPVGTAMAAILLGEQLSLTDGLAIAVILFAAILPTLAANTVLGQKSIS
jgi:drug/metabolite transporter (DMT)-like permease